MATDLTTSEPRSPGAPPPPPQRPRSWWRRWFLPLLAGVILAAGGGVAAYMFARPHASQKPWIETIRPSGVPATLSTQDAGLMSLQPVKGRRAANFTLTDQHGHTVSLSTFRGHVVVLEFMDPHCTDICPIVASEFVEAEHHLAGKHLGVVFAAVNVNRHALSVATVRKFTDEHLLNTIPTWHFMTGSVATLEATWNHYGILVHTRRVDGQWTPLHSSLIFFIGPNGKERYLAAPVDDHHTTPTHKAFLPAPQLTAWGQGIAKVAESIAHH